VAAGGGVMSLDVYLTISGIKSQSGSGIFVRENGSIKEISREELNEKFPGCEPIILPADDEDASVYSANITHNLGRMASEAGVYEYLWRPDEVGIKIAAQLIDPLQKGLILLENEPERFKEFNPSNGWGSYDGLVTFIREYLDACNKYPTASVNVWR